MLNSKLRTAVIVKSFTSAQKTFTQGERILIPIITPSGYKSVGHVGITTDGFTSSAHGYITDNIADIYVSGLGGTGAITVNVLFVVK